MRYLQSLISLVCCVALTSLATPAQASVQPSAPSNYTLFAVLRPSSCASSLMYGPSSLSEEGSEDGNSAYLCTDHPHKNAVHSKWMQVVEFQSSWPCFIYWNFDTPRTLQDHFITAVNEGVQVSYSVECPSHPPVKIEALWRFGQSAGDMSQKFAVEESTSRFSDSYGVWGTGEDKASFWGIGNFGGSDVDNCKYYWRNGVPLQNATDAVIATYMYFANGRGPFHLELSPGVAVPSTPEPSVEPSAEPTAEPSAEPTTNSSPTQDPAPTTAPTTTLSGQPTVNPSVEPTDAPTTRPTTAPTIYESFVTMWVEQPVDGVSYAAYEADQFGYDSVFEASIAAACDTSTNAIVSLMVTDTSRHSTTKADGPANLRTGAKELSVATVNIQYTVHVAASSGITYDQLSTRLTHSVESGEFTASLHFFALSLNVPALVAASSTSVTTKNTTPSEPTESTSGSKSGMSVAAIVGIVLGVCAVVVVCVCVFVLWYQWRQAKMTGLLHMDTLHRQASERPKMCRGSIDRGTSVYFYTSDMSEKESVVNPLRNSRRCVADDDRVL